MVTRTAEKAPPVAQLPAERERTAGASLLLRLLGWALALFPVLLWPTDADLARAAVLSAMVSVGCLLVVRDSRRGIGGAATLYLLVFIAFHLGLVWSYMLIGEEALVGGGLNTWFYAPDLVPTVRLVCIGMISLAAGVTIGGWASSRNTWKARELPRGSSVLAGTIATGVGWFLMGRFFVTNGGLGLLQAGYGEFFEASAVASFGYGTLLLGFGCALWVASGGRWAVGGWLSWIAFAALMFGVGARGAALYPLVAMLFASASRQRLRKRALALGVVGLAILISAVRVGRNLGVSGSREALTDANPLEALAEMGYSIYPVLLTRGWIDGGEATLGGSSFFVLPLRFFEAVVQGRVVDAAGDPRFFNVLIAERAGQVGGSPVAEAYMNGGTLWVVGVMLAFGLLLGVIGSFPLTPWYTALGAVLLVPLMLNVRNFFAVIPYYFVIGIGLLLVARFVVSRTSGAPQRGRR